MNSREMVACVVFGVIGLAAFASHLNNLPKKTGREICLKITAAQKAELMQLATKMHVFPGRMGEITEVDQRVWKEIPNNGKVSLALAVYCDLGAKETYLGLRGWRDGETKAYIVDGNYMD